MCSRVAVQGVARFSWRGGEAGLTLDPVWGLVLCLIPPLLGQVFKDVPGFF